MKINNIILVLLTRIILLSSFVIYFSVCVIRDVFLFYVYIYAAYDIRRPICDSGFFPFSHLCLVVYMYPTPICDVQFATVIFFDLGAKK